MKTTRQIVQTLFPVATAAEMARGGHLQRRFAMYQRNYEKCWEDAHAENESRQGNKVSTLKRASK